MDKDRWILVGGVVVFTLLVTYGFVINNPNLIQFAREGFLMFTSPLLVVLNREIVSPGKNGSGNGGNAVPATPAPEPDATTPHARGTLVVQRG